MKDSIDELATALRPMVFRLYYMVRRQTPQLRLTLTQGSILRNLVESGQQRMSALAEAEAVRMPSMTDVVARLERLGLVRRSQDRDDRRATLVAPTAEGERFYAELVATRERFLAERLSQLDEADRVAITRALPALERLIAAGAPTQTAQTQAAEGTKEGVTEPR